MRRSMLVLVSGLLLGLGLVARAEYRPLGNLQYALLQTREAGPICVTIDGVDWDIEKIRDEYHTPWTWPEGTEASLRKHLAREHHVIGLERLSFADVKKIHAVIHERERAAKPLTLSRPAPAPAPVYRSTCPGGVCPAPRRGWFQWK